MPDGQCITLILSNADGNESDGVTLGRDVWNAVIPIALWERPARLAEFVSLDFGSGEAGPIGVESDDYVLSLFWLAAVVECCGFSPAVKRISDCWMHIPSRDPQVLGIRR